MKEQLQKLFERLRHWKESVPIGGYRYTGHSTIYESTTGVFQPCEREILVHRYLNRYLVGKYVRFHLQYVDQHYQTVKSSCWQYACILSVVHGNEKYGGGYIQIKCLIANTITHETITLNAFTQVTCELISAAWYNELLKMVVINK